MVQTADHRDGPHGSEGWRLDYPWIGRIALERKIRAAVVIIIEVCPEHPFQMRLVQHDNVIQAFAADRSDQPLDVGIGLSRRLHLICALAGELSW